MGRELYVKLGGCFILVMCVHPILPTVSLNLDFSAQLQLLRLER